jgi:hypothetical protein
MNLTKFALTGLFTLAAAGIAAAATLSPIELLSI